jgi:hypothetical protein
MSFQNQRLQAGRILYLETWQIVYIGNSWFDHHGRHHRNAVIVDRAALYYIQRPAPSYSSEMSG